MICFSFDLKGKVALITGGAQGLGFGIGSELLSNGVRGVTLVDINADKGKQAAKTLNEKFGRGKSIFVPADVSNSSQFETAFKVSIRHWGGLDVVINNAGIVNEIEWQWMVNVNVVGTLQGVFLGVKYMSAANLGRGGVIINIATVDAIDSLYVLPIYSSTKSFILDVSRALGHHVYYDHSKIKMITVSPGATNTSMFNWDNFSQGLSNTFYPNLKKFKNVLLEIVSDVARDIVNILKRGNSGSVWVVEDGSCYVVEFPDRKCMRKNRYVKC
ncbi:hypothetical protein RI129_006429 [Pyrocoelia pectoralis]|uniref:Uncharacterized protein n=1 Tax=Pyrocoelia pectoralis TaxID=417401 RepID=A0AAN7VFA3_9COLE